MNKIILTDTERHIVETEGTIKYLKEKIKNNYKMVSKYNAELNMYKKGMAYDVSLEMKKETLQEIRSIKEEIEWLQHYLNVKYITYECECKEREAQLLREQNPAGGSNPWDL